MGEVETPMRKRRLCGARHKRRFHAGGSNGMRGLHSTLAVDSGITGHAVAAALGHESFEKTTAGSYVQPGAVAHAQQRQVLKVLAGGRN